MKTILVSLMFSLVAAANTVQINANNAYIPSGFDSNSEALVVVNGLFPNGCYSWKQASVEHKSEMRHDVSLFAEVSDGPCLKIIIPFSEEVMLGQLKTGDHTIRFLSGDGTYFEQVMTIE